MKEYKTGLDEIKRFLKSKGWAIVKYPENGEEDYYVQGVTYMNLCKDGVSIHLEYGDEDCVCNGETCGDSLSVGS